METKAYKRGRAYFVKYHLGLSQLLTPAEARFLLHMVDFSYWKKQGYKTDFTRAEYMQRMGLKGHTFEAAARSLMGLGLVCRTADSNRNRVGYELCEPTYEKLITIVSCTTNADRLRGFLDFNLRKLGRSIDSITSEELEELCV